MKYETAAAFERKLREEMSGLASVSASRIAVPSSA